MSSGTTSLSQETIQYPYSKFGVPKHMARKMVKKVLISCKISLSKILITQPQC